MTHGRRLRARRARPGGPAPGRRCWPARAARTCVVCAVVPAPWPPSPGEGRRRVPGLPRQAGGRGARARRARGCPSDVPATFAWSITRAPLPAGLLEVAEQRDASADRGRLVAAAGGSGTCRSAASASRLLHSSPSRSRSRRAGSASRAGRARGAGDRRVRRHPTRTTSSSPPRASRHGSARRCGIASFAVRPRAAVHGRRRHARPTTR